MTNKEIYENDMRTNNKEYAISLKEFKAWLAENKMVDFNEVLKNKDNYYIAVDFSIPLTMVKYLKRA